MTKMLKYVLSQLAATKRTWPHVAQQSGVPLSTLRKIAQGHTKNPGVKHIEALEEFFKNSTPQE